MMRREQAFAALTSAGAPFEVVDARHEGGPARAFHTGPRCLRTLFDQGRSARPFLCFENEALSFEETWRRAAGVAWRLKADHGITKGDRVAIAMRNCPEWIIAFQAIVSLGAIAVALNTHWSSDELSYALTNSGAKVLFADHYTLPKLDCETATSTIIAVRCADIAPRMKAYEIEFGNAEAEAMPEVVINPEDSATILYTSGSTGRPKGVLSTHRNIITTLMSWELDAAAQELLTGPAPAQINEPAALLAVPLFHVTGLHAVYLASLRSQRRVVIMQRWNAHSAACLIEKEKITNFTAPATITGDLLAIAKSGAADLSSLLAIGGGGAARSASQVCEINQTWKNAAPLTGWGMTETNASGTSIHGQEYLERPTSSGRPSFMMDLRIVNEFGNALPPNLVGELQVRGASVAQNYWECPEARAEAFDGQWFRTGDVAYLDEEGYLFITDRIKDVVIRGGENIGCGAIETALLEYPGVVEAVVYGLPDERLGERVAATVRSVNDVDTDALRQFLLERLAPFQVPETLLVATAPLPRGATGKILKRQVRDDALAVEQNKA